MKPWLTLAAIVAFSVPAFAQPEPTEPAPPGAAPAPPPAPPPAGAAPPASYPLEGEAPPPTATDPTSDIRRHDGFYLRFGIGLGGLRLTRDTESTSANADAAYTGESEIKGPAGVAEISIGGTVANGLVLCGTILGHEHADATLERKDKSDVDLGQPLSFGLIGMGAHYFLDDRGGFHVGGTLGLAYAVADVSASRFKTLGGIGIGASLASGYDWWVSDQWALGVLGRLTLARLQGEATDAGVTANETDTAAAFGVMFSVLHH